MKNISRELLMTLVFNINVIINDSSTIRLQILRKYENLNSISVINNEKNIEDRSLLKNY